MNQGVSFLSAMGAPPVKPDGGATGGQGAAGPPGAFQQTLLEALGGQVLSGTAPGVAAGPLLVTVPPEGLLVPPDGAATGQEGAGETVSDLAALLLARVVGDPAGQARAPAQAGKAPGQAPAARMTRPEGASLVAMLMQTATAPEGETADETPDVIDPTASINPTAAIDPTVMADPTALLEALVVAGTQSATPAAAAPGQAAGPHGQSPAPVAPVLAEQPDAHLEAFTRQAATWLQGGGGEVPAGDTAAPDQPRFADLIQLVADAEQAPQAPAGQQAQARTQTQAEALLQTQTQALTETPALADESAPEAPAEPAAPVVAELRPQQQAGGAGQVTLTESEHPVQPEPVMRQVTKFVKVMVESGRSEVKLHLHPEELGAIQIKLVLEGGVIRANLAAQDAAVKQVLEANLEQLRSRMAGQGLQVSEVHVAVGEDGSFGQPQHSQHGGRQEQQNQNHPNRGRPHFMQSRMEEEGQKPGIAQQSPPPWARRWSGSRINSLA